MNMKRIIIIAGLIILNSQFSILNSQNVIRPKIACPNNIWVNSYNGVLFYQRADLSIPNRNMPLDAVFYYNSSSNTVNYGYGNGWSLGYEYRYIVDSLGIIIETGDGRQDLYTSTSLEAPAGVFSTLAPLPTGGYTLTTKEGMVYTFADTVSKRVTQIHDRNNNTLNFTYANGLLASLGDANGRMITFSWSDALLTTVGTNIDDRQWHYAYDTVGNLVSVTNPMNYTVYYGYNRDNRINRFTDEAGFSTLITYNDDGMAHRIKTDLTDKSIRYEQSSRQTVIVDYMGTHSSALSGTSPNLGEESHNQFTTYRWDTLGRVVEKTGNCCGYTSKLEYDEENNVIRSEDANGNVTTCTYDGNGNMLTLADPMGNTETYTYTADGFNNIATYTDKLGHQYTFSYDANGNLITINGPMGSTTQYTYNSYGQILTQTDAMNHTTTMAYDTYGNLISVTDALGDVLTISYDAFGNPTAQTTSSGATQYFIYDRLGRLSTTIDALNNRTDLTYDVAGRLVTLHAPLSTNHFTYDALGQPLAVTDGRQATTTYTYNAKGKPSEVRNAMNNATHLFYDDRDQLILTIDALGDSTRYQYDAGGNMTSVSLPNGQEITYTYNALNRLIQTADQYGIMQTTLYDAMGNVVATINANGDTTHMTYDALGRLIQTTDPLGNSDNYTYDLTGNLLTYTDANGNTTTYNYDAVGNMLTETDALNNVTTYTYDADGNLTSVTDANGNTTAYTYDAKGQLTIITFANGKTQQFWYDAVGNVVKQKDESGNQTLMAYDANGNLLSRIYPDGSSDQYTYDLNGNMLTANNANANITFTYDANGQMLSESSWYAGASPATTQYTYDILNGIINITYPSGRQVTERYDRRGRLSNIVSNNDTVATFTYTPTDYIASRTYGNGDVTTFSYDAANRLTAISASNSQFSILNLDYTYDPVGNILSKTDAVHLDRSETCSYDALHRLTSFQRGQVNYSGVIPNPMKQLQYNLDALGNRTTVTADGTTTNYAHNNMNAYTTVDNETMQYDGKGNMTSDGTHTYQYNYRNRMISVDNGSIATYQYDALDRRICKTITTDTIQYYYRGVQCIEEWYASDPLVTSYIYGNSIDDILFIHRNSQDYYFHKNHLVSVMAITDNNGFLVETYDYDPYGFPTIFNATGVEVVNSTIGNTIMFTGREYDHETGLYYYRTRIYNIQQGRFMQHDPLTYVEGYNMYEYVGTNPILFNDPLGLSRVGGVGGGFNNYPLINYNKIHVGNNNLSIFSMKKVLGVGSDQQIINSSITRAIMNLLRKIRIMLTGKKILIPMLISAGIISVSSMSSAIASELGDDINDESVDCMKSLPESNGMYEKISSAIGGGMDLLSIGLAFRASAGFFATKVWAPISAVSFGWGIGQWADEKWRIGQNAWDFYKMDNQEWIYSVREKMEDFIYNIKYGKNGILKTPTLKGGVTYIEYK